MPAVCILPGGGEGWGGSLTYEPALTFTAGHLQGRRTEVPESPAIQNLMCWFAFLFCFAFLLELLLFHLLHFCLKFHFLTGKLPPYSDADLGKDLTCSSSVWHACVLLWLFNKLQGRESKPEAGCRCVLNMYLTTYFATWTIEPDLEQLNIPWVIGNWIWQAEFSQSENVHIASEVLGDNKHVLIGGTEVQKEKRIFWGCWETHFELNFSKILGQGLTPDCLGVVFGSLPSICTFLSPLSLQIEAQGIWLKS